MYELWCVWLFLPSYIISQDGMLKCPLIISSLPLYTLICANRFFDLFSLLSLCPAATALSLVPEQAEPSPWSSPVLVLPVLQLLSCSDLTEPLADRRTHSLNKDLAHRLLRRISRPAGKPGQVTISELLTQNDQSESRLFLNV